MAKQGCASRTVISAPKSTVSSSSVNQIWELYLFENGDAMIRMEKKSTSDGTFSFFGTTFSINEGECVSFYRTGESTGKFTAATEVYDIAKHVS